MSSRFEKYGCSRRPVFSTQLSGDRTITLGVTAPLPYTRSKERKPTCEPPLNLDLLSKPWWSRVFLKKCESYILLFGLYTLLVECYLPQKQKNPKTCTPECQQVSSTRLGHQFQELTHLELKTWKTQINHKWEEVLQVAWTKTHKYETAQHLVCTIGGCLPYKASDKTIPIVKERRM